MYLFQHLTNRLRQANILLMRHEHSENGDKVCLGRPSNIKEFKVCYPGWWESAKKDSEKGKKTSWLAGAERNVGMTSPIGNISNDELFTRRETLMELLWRVPRPFSLRVHANLQTRYANQSQVPIDFSKASKNQVRDSAMITGGSIMESEYVPTYRPDLLANGNTPTIVAFIRQDLTKILDSGLTKKVKTYPWTDKISMTKLSGGPVVLSHQQMESESRRLHLELTWGRGIRSLVATIERSPFVLNPLLSEQLKVETMDSDVSNALDNLIDTLRNNASRVISRAGLKPGSTPGKSNHFESYLPAIEVELEDSLAVQRSMAGVRDTWTQVSNISVYIAQTALSL